jgi:hypothetical protein
VSNSQPEQQESRSRFQPHTAAGGGSLDGLGAADHDQPYRFGWRPRSSVPYPFSTRQYGRLLVMRSCVQNGLFGADDVAA